MTPTKRHKARVEVMIESTAIHKILPSFDEDGIEHPAERADLRRYTRAKLAIAGQLRALMELLRRRASESRVRRSEGLLAKLAEDRFTLAVLGNFNRGKSSLMNAIIGQALLPVGTQPLTSAVTVLKYGPVERLIIRREGSQLPEVQPVATLSDFVTERGNPGNRKRVKTAILELPLAFLRRGLEFVDTPGVGSPIEANTATTRAFLPECDAVLFVVGADTPLDDAELAFLQDTRDQARKIFFILNKIDLCADDEDRQKCARTIENKIREKMGVDKLRIFPVSAKMGLAEKLGAQQSQSNSGLPAFEESLSAFLSSEKAAVLLVTIIDRALRLVAEEGWEIELSKRGREIGPASRHKKLELVRQTFERLNRDRTALFDQLRACLIRRVKALLSPLLTAFVESQRTLANQTIKRAVIRFGWQLGEDCSSWYGDLALSTARAAMDSWMREHLQNLDLNSDEEANSLWEQILANERERPHIAAGAFGLPAVDGNEPVPPLHIELGIGTPVLRQFTWNPRGRLWQMLPAALARNRLTNVLLAESLRMFVSLEHDAVVSIEKEVIDAVERLERESTDRGEETEGRFTAAINGARFPRRTLSPVAELPEEAGWGERALRNVRKRLLGIQEQILNGGPQTSAEINVRPDISSEVSSPKLREVEVAIGDRLKTRGCPVCDYLVDVAFNFFAEEQFALYVDENAQAAFSMIRGFCPLHLWQLHAVSSPVSASGGLPLSSEKLLDDFCVPMAKAIQRSFHSRPKNAVFASFWAARKGTSSRSWLSF